MNGLFKAYSVAALMGALAVLAVRAVSLEEGFLNPPHDAKPQTWWHWMNGNVTKEGITADLEAMAEIGIGGAQIFDAGCDIPPGPVAFNSPAWFDVIAHAAKQARRLGIELALPNCSGWSSSGGPWNPPENGMKFLEMTETRVSGPTTFRGKLAQPRNPIGFYEDIAVIAYPVPPASRWRMADAGAQVRNTEKGVVVTFPKAVEVSGYSFRLAYPHCWSGSGTMSVEISDDGQEFRPFLSREVQLATSGKTDNSIRFMPFEKPVTARAFRMTPSFHKSFKVTMKDVSVEKKMLVGDLQAKIFRHRAPVQIERVPTTANQVIDKRTIVDLTSRMAKDGTLEWNVPTGEWTILRLGYAANGQRNHPASKFGVGLEVDKLSKGAMDYHFDAYVGKLCDYLGPLAGNVSTGLNNILVDSYEVGSQNWTKGFEKEFARRRGYSMAPYYPVFTGSVVGSVDETERFLGDFRRTVADLFAENYAGELAAKCHERGLKLSLEPYGSCPADNLQYGSSVDIPMGEYWSARGPVVWSVGNARFPAYLAHVWGRRYAATESFTSGPGEGTGRWQKTPYGLKAQGDRVYASGVNRIIYHRFTHQPWPGNKYVPGMTMGKWGMHFDRTQTWWKQAKDWITYQSRCQFLLQEGKVVSEGLFYCGEAAPNAGGNTDGSSEKPVTLPYGYNWDICSRDALMKLTVDERGRILVPGGIAYEMLILPKDETMSLDVLQKIGELVDAGAKVVAEVKPVRTPGLRGYPTADGELRKLADKIWKRKGLLACSVDEAIQQLGIEPDFAWAGKKGRELGVDDIAYIHRDYAAAGEGYFVAMPNRTSTSVVVSFRQTGRVPELWDAERGTMEDAPVWREENGRTYVRLDFRPSGSVFVMFRRPAVDNHAVALDVKAQAVVDPSDHTLEIVHAEYGWFGASDGERTLSTNVTEAVRAAVRGDSVRIFISNKTMVDGKDSAPMKKKTARITYRLDGVEKTVDVMEHTEFALSATSSSNEMPDVLPDFEIHARKGGRPAILAYRPLEATVTMASGAQQMVRADVPAATLVSGPWAVAFPKGWDAPERTVFPKLISWTESPVDGIRYFSGSSVYGKRIRHSHPKPGERLILDLGTVKDFAEVRVNGVDFPVLWKPPFRVDITDALQDGDVLDVRVRVTNRWPNRLIGDDRLYEEDCEWKKADFREAIVELPQWVKDGQRSPTGRHTFTTWKHWNKDDNLLPSGLIGPVLLRTAVPAK